MDRLDLVELIEAQKLKLSPHARELWDELDALIYFSDDNRIEFTSQEYDVTNRMAKLARPDKRVLAPLRVLRAGLYSSDHAPSKGEPGEPYRVNAVISAARALDVREGLHLRTTDQRFPRPTAASSGGPVDLVCCASLV